MIDDFRMRLAMENYFGALSDINLNARGLEHVDPLDYYVKNIRLPNAREKKLLEASIIIADEMLKEYRGLYVIPWKILISNDHIESGFPHTHIDYIIVPHIHVTISAKRPRQLAETLIHEKIHIYQRIYPCECHMLYTEVWNLAIVGLRSRHPSYSKMRANPDINDILYKDKNTDTGIFLSFSDSSSQPSLSLTSGDQRDHPHEIMAYVLTHIITNKTSYLQTTNEKYIEPTLKWLHQSSITQGS